MRIDVVTPPAAEPVTIAEAKDHCRVVHNADDTLIGAQISAAREYVERIIGYALVAQSLRGTLDCFPPTICVQGVGIAVTSLAYTDVDGVEQILAPAAYSIDVSGGGARITPAFGTTWPSVRAQPACVRLEFTAGYAVPSVPASLKAAIKLIVGDLYENREAAVTQQGVMVTIENPTVDTLIFPHRIVLP